MSVSINKVAQAIDPSLFPDFDSDITTMLDSMRTVYKNQPASSHANAFAKILVEHGCYPDNF